MQAEDRRKRKRYNTLCYRPSEAETEQRGMMCGGYIVGRVRDRVETRERDVDNRELRGGRQTVRLTASGKQR